MTTEGATSSRERLRESELDKALEPITGDASNNVSQIREDSWRYIEIVRGGPIVTMTTTSDGQKGRATIWADGRAVYDHDPNYVALRTLLNSGKYRVTRAQHSTEQ